MKTHKAIPVIAIICCMAMCAIAGEPLQLPGYRQSLFAPTASQPSEQQSLLLKRSAARHNPDYCAEYKRHEIAGWVMFGVGAGMIAGGTVMVYRGSMDIYNTYNNATVSSEGVATPPFPRRDAILLGVGSGLDLVGLILVPTGLSMGISGTVRRHKYCGRGTSYLITPNFDNGVGMLAAF